MSRFPRFLKQPFYWVIVSLLAPCSVFAEQPAAPQAIDFNTHIRPIFTAHCTACHGGVKQAGDISFVRGNSVLPPEGWIVEPGEALNSILVERITETDPDLVMPPPEHGPPLSPKEIALLKQWINEGAEWGNHWAFSLPQKADLPKLKQEQWCRSRIDHFILSRLEKQNLSPATQASRLEWLRRASFDLTGLPPDPEMKQWFVSGTRPEDYEKAVDQLLASPAYGERWAAMWLDLARYADSQGYEKDSLRTMWPYRDWLIRAHNENMGYDQFTRYQLAGDFIENAPLDALIATGFHRNTPTNSEGGTDDEEFRISSLIDRVNTTWEVWQGLTFKCIQCHSHPYEPIEHDEYYQFMAFFNTSQDWDLRDDAPKLKVPNSAEKYSQMKQLIDEFARLDQQRVQLTAQTSQASTWVPSTPVKAESTGLTELVILQTDTSTEVQTRGTVSHNSQFTIESTVPTGKEITALQLAVLPLDLEKALHTPEAGFVFSEVKASLVTIPSEDQADEKAADQKPIPVALKWALGDESQPFGKAQHTLDPNSAGWGAKPKISHRRELVLIPESPVTLAENQRLQLIIKHKDAPGDLEQLVANRLQIATSIDPHWTELISSVDFLQREKALEKAEAGIRSIPGNTVPIMRQQTKALERQTAVFQRGNWLNKEQAVSPGIPAVMQFEGVENPHNRLELADWLVSEQNPLTARVAVNRYWEQLFGQGLVSTITDLGSSGVAPSHPLLLDDLAWRFQHEMQWDIKALLKEMVLCSTYRQAAVTTPEKQNQDATNQLLSRGPRTRLSAEMVRDNALMVSGLLSRDMYGPPVMPPQPDGIWRAARSRLRWNTDVGSKRYRRGLYTIWRRSSPYPSFMAFDAPQRVICSGQRVATNTPLQALVTLNDPVYMECAMALAQLNSPQEADATLQIAQMYEAAVGHGPTEEKLELLKQVYEQSLERLSESSEARKAMQIYHRDFIEQTAEWEKQKQANEKKVKNAEKEKATQEQIAALKAELPSRPELEISPELGAMTLTANVILNLDTVLTK